MNLKICLPKSRTGYKTGVMAVDKPLCRYFLTLRRQEHFMIAESHIFIVFGVPGETAWMNALLVCNIIHHLR